MDQAKRSLLLTVLVVACGGIAVLLFRGQIKGRSQGVEAIEPSETVWLMCTNPSCQAKYEIPKKTYFEFVENNRSGTLIPGMECEKCGQAKAYRAVKCEKCGHVFLYGAKGFDFADRCPKCHYSKMEQDRKARSK